MTSQPQPAPGSASQYLRPLRDIAAYALVAAPAAMLFVAMIRLIPSGVGLDFQSRAQDSFYSYVNVPTIFFPLGAVLLALLVRPQHGKARLITLIALIEYAMAAVFAIVFGILVGLIKIASFSVRTAFEELLVRVAWLAVFAVAAFAVYQIWRHLFHTAKPKPQPGLYGQPTYGVPGAYPGQPGYGQPGTAQPGYGQPPGTAEPPAYGQAGAPGHGQAGFGQAPYGSPAYGQSPHGAPGAPGAYPGQPAPAATQPVPPYPAGTYPAGTYPASTHPVSTQPLPEEPTTGAPAGSYAARPAEPGYSAFTEPTQVVPQPGAEPERTQIVDDHPADDDSSRR